MKCLFFSNLKSLSSSFELTDLLEENTMQASWQISYYLAQYPQVRLIPCYTLDPPEETLSRPEEFSVILLFLSFFNFV